MQIALGVSVVVLLVLAFFYIRACQRLAIFQERLRNCEALEEKLHAQVSENKTLCAKNAELAAQIEYEKKKADELTVTFKALSSDVLRESQKSFFEVAKQTFEKYTSSFQQEMKEKHASFSEIMKPLTESLKAVDGKIGELEKSRISAYASLSEQLKLLTANQGQLQSETGKLVKALRAPAARGQWGEIQLRRVVEMAGMLSYCDFTEQQTLDGEGARFRPDLIVRLPNSRSIVVDAKSPLQAYLEALDAEDEEKKTLKLKEHAKHLKKHLLELGEKAYWEKITPTPEFVVLFLPGEAFFSAALEQDPALIEYGVDRKVLIASPTTLIALLRAVAYGWKEELIAEHAQAICDLGKQLHDRLRVMTEHFVRLKKSLDGSVEAYNKAVTSFETRVLPAARKFEEMAVVESEPIPEIPLIERLTKPVGVE